MILTVTENAPEQSFVALTSCIDIDIMMEGRTLRVPYEWIADLIEYLRRFLSAKSPCSMRGSIEQRPRNCEREQGI